MRYYVTNEQMRTRSSGRWEMDPPG